MNSTSGKNNDGGNTHTNNNHVEVGLQMPNSKNEASVNKNPVEISKPSQSILNKLPGGRSTVLNFMNQKAENIIKEIQVVDAPLNQILFCKKVRIFTNLIIPSCLLAITHSGNSFLNTIGFYVAANTNDIGISTAFGLSIFLNNVTIYSLTQPIIEKIGISCAKCYGAKNYNGVKESFLRGIVFFLLYCIFLYIPIILTSKYILVWLGINHDVAERTAHYQSLLFPIDITRLIGEILVTYMVSQGIESSFGVFTMVNLVIAFPVAYYLGVQQEMGISGWMIARALFDALNILSILGVYFFKLKSKKITKNNFKQAFTGLKQYFFDIAKYTGALYSEVLGWELSTILVTMTGSEPQIAAFTCNVNVAYLVYNLGNGFSNTARTRINYLLGQKKGRAAKNFFTIILTGLVIFGVFIGGLMLISREPIADFYAKSNEELREQLVRLLIWYGFLLNGDFLFAFMFTITRSTNQIVYNMIIDYTFLIFGHFLVSYYILKKMNGDCVTILIVLEASLFVVYFFLLFRLCTMNWDKIEVEEEEEIKQVIENNEPLLFPLPGRQD